MTEQKTDSPEKAALIVAFVDDLMFQVKIDKVVANLGHRLRTIENATAIGAVQEEVTDHRPGEPLSGRAGLLFEQLTAAQPALLIFDLHNEGIPWERWIPALKSSPATRRVPILAYGSHVAEETLAEARRLGADEVVPRSRFSNALPQLVETLARLPDNQALAAACADPLAPRARQGIEMFNEGHYYKCHDYLEEAWMEDQGPGRDLYRAILQVGIAYFQIERGNYRGALKMLLRVHQWLAPLPAVCRGVNVTRLREDVANVQDAVTALGPESLDQIDRALFRQIELL
jgi:predicted metal-dependent hydrolase